MSDFFDMGGYAAFIWPAYGISALVLTVIVVQSYRALSRNKKDLTLLQQAEGGGRRQRSEEASDDDADLSGVEDIRETQA